MHCSVVLKLRIISLMTINQIEIKKRHNRCTNSISEHGKQVERIKKPQKGLGTPFRAPQVIWQLRQLEDFEVDIKRVRALILVEQALETA